MTLKTDYKNKSSSFSLIALLLFILSFFQNDNILDFRKFFNGLLINGFCLFSSDSKIE